MSLKGKVQAWKCQKCETENLDFLGSNDFLVCAGCGRVFLAWDEVTILFWDEDEQAWVEDVRM